ncbi:MAG: metal-dependent transcriptional regulator [Candidatus Micrarchaeaceae archaeon]
MKGNIKDVTRRERDAIILIGKNKESKFPIRISSLAKQLNVRTPTAEEIVEKLVAKNLVEKSGGLLILSEKGVKYYQETIMKHRAMETFLAGCGVDPDTACKQVSAFDYLMDKGSALKILKKLGNPTNCPHGLKIVER